MSPSGPRRVEPSVVEVPGPWTHRLVAAAGERLHVAEYGDGPLVLLVHGFPQFWWAWRHQLAALADAGYRAVAVDLKGYGGSDKPPRGYDVPALADDLAGLVRALGEESAHIVGHDWGGVLGWTMAGRQPQVVRSLTVTGIAHPLLMLHSILTDSRQRSRSRYLWLDHQIPRRPEHRLVAEDGARVEAILRSWAGPVWPRTADFAEAAGRYRQAIQIPKTSHLSLEYYRWVVRSTVRPDGLQWRRELARPVAAPVLQVHGAADSCILPTTAAGSGRYTSGGFTAHVLPEVGHFVPEEAPDDLNRLLVQFLSQT